MRSGVLVVQAIYVCHEKEQVGVDHCRRYGRECVVVAKLDFRNGKRVVLVHNGDHTHIQELIKRPLRIQVPRTLFDVSMSATWSVLYLFGKKYLFMRPRICEVLQWP